MPESNSTALRSSESDSDFFLCPQCNAPILTDGSCQCEAFKRDALAEKLHPVVLPISRAIEHLRAASPELRPHSPLGRDFEIANLKHEIARLQAILREPHLPADERIIAEFQLADFLESLSETEANNHVIHATPDYQKA
jgi:hypothetical protein